MASNLASDGFLAVASVSPVQSAPSPEVSYKGAGSVAFFTAVLLGIVVLKRLPKRWHRTWWSKQLLNRLRA